MLVSSATPKLDITSLITLLSQQAPVILVVANGSPRCKDATGNQIHLAERGGK